MGPFQGRMLLAFACLVCMTGLSLSFSCQAPDWDDSAGPNPFIERRGKVVLVALLKGYCGYCLHQARRMHLLKNQLINGDFPDIDMLIINGGEQRSRDLAHNLINASPIPVIQDTPEHVLYNQVFAARKDDFIVYDRCNQKAIYIPSPLSDLGSTITRQVLEAVHNGHHNCYCSLDYPTPNPDDVMVGDDPGVRFYQTHDMSRNILHCSSEDSDCLMFQSAITTMNRRNVGRSDSEAFRRRLLRRTLRRMRQRARGAPRRPGLRGYVADFGTSERGRDQGPHLGEERVLGIGGSEGGTGVERRGGRRRGLRHGRRGRFGWRRRGLRRHMGDIESQENGQVLRGRTSGAL